jgi:hypothetical protein
LGEEINFLVGDVLIVNYVPVGLDVERIENTAPPIRPDVLFEVGDGAQDGPGMLSVFASLWRFIRRFFFVHSFSLSLL